MTKVTSRATTFTPVTAREISDPVFDELDELLGVPTDRTYRDQEPPAAGWSEIATIVSILVDSKEVLLPILIAVGARFGGPAIGKFRNLLQNSRRSRESGRAYTPICIEVGTNPDFGSIRFYFHGDPDPKQLIRQLETVSAIIGTLPNEALNASPGPQEYGYFWDKERSEWRGDLFYIVRNEFRTEGPWLPPDLFEEDEQM